MSNPANQPAQSVVVYDQTPTYTALNGPVLGATVAPGVTCNVTVPSSGANIAGYVGPLQWDCTGSFPPGDEGSVSFEVRISP